MQGNRRLSSVTIEDALNVKRNVTVEQEITTAVSDLIAGNVFDPVAISEDGPYALAIRVAKGTLYFDISDEENRDLGTVELPLQPLSKIIRDYFMICESHMAAGIDNHGKQLETLDMARRGIHNEGSVELANLLHGKISIDFQTARRLFTLVSALHIGQRGEALMGGA
ncbi:MAG: UPF0262 family protein [Alphaproteobacteria bacterium]|nr:UPF0262 family protein [Alphaproteobacteria bacterium]